ncbi:MAG: DUF4347 domain-containing protein, partial [Caenispirillum bisanense]|nr:DUF4347 domain-containing protein [Caenispirillum bisanense]
MLSQAAPLAMALEPRFMFDAAGAASGVEAVREATAHAMAGEAAQPDHDESAAALDRAVADHGLPPAERKDVLFVDTTVRDAQALIDAAGPGVEVVLLDASRDGLTQMAEWAQGRSGYDAVHLVTHGSAATLHFGSLTMTADTVAERAADLAAVGAALTEAGDILVYGCDVGQGSAGAAFVAALSDATGADVAASDDGTGAATLGGDWALEVRAGDVDGDGIYADRTVEYDHLLALPDGVQDVTPTTEPGSFLSGFTLTAPAGSHRTDDPAGIYFSNATSLDPFSFEIAADGTTVASFDLTGISFSKYNTNGSFSFTITGTKIDGTTTVQTTFTTANNSGTYTSGTYTAFTGITRFTVTMDPTGTDYIEQNTLDTFTIANAVAPVSNQRPVVDLNGATAPNDAAGDDVTVAFTEQTPVAIASGATISDGDTANTLTEMSVSLTNAQAGDQLSVNGTFGGLGLINQTGTTLTFSAEGSRADYQSLLRAIQFNNTSDNPSTTPRTVSVTVTDNSGGGNATSTARTATINITAQNDAATDITLSSTSVNQSGGTNAVVGTLGSNDPDGPSATYTLVAGSGDTDNALFNISGTSLRANDAAALTPGTYSVRVQVSDGSGGTYAEAFSITVADNVAPVFDGAPATANITTTGFDLSASLNESGTLYYVVVADGAAAPSASQIIAGQNASGAAALAAGSQVVSTTPFSHTFAVTGLTMGTAYDVYVVARDAAGKPNVTAVQTKLDVTTVSNNVPVTTLPTTPVVQEDSSDTAITGISIADTDGHDQTVTLTVANGTVTVGTTTGLTLNSGAYSNASSVSFSGTLAQVNAALGSLTFSPTGDFAGTATLRVQTSDGKGGSDDDTLNITVSNTNDNPTLTGLPASVTVVEDTLSNVDLSAATLADVDPSDTLTLTLTAGAGSFTAATGGGVTVTGSGSGTLTLSGTAAAIDTFLNTASNVRYTSASNVNGAGATSISVTVNDGAGSGDLSFGPVAVNVTASNDTPVLGGTVGATWTENGDYTTTPAAYSGTGQLLFSSPTLNDADTTTAFTGATLTVALSQYRTGDLISIPVSYGTVTYATGTPGVVSVNGTPVGNVTGGYQAPLVITFLAAADKAAIEAVMGAVTYSIYANDDPTAGDRTVTATFNDAANGGTGALEGQLTGTLTVVATNDTPRTSVTGATPTYAENGPAQQLFTAATLSAVEAGQSITGVTLTVAGVADGMAERVLVDGVPVTLTDGNTGTSATNGISYSVSVTGSTAQVTLTCTDTAAAWGGYITDLQYINTSDNPTVAGTRTVTLTAVSDSGGGAAATATVSHVATVTVTASNDPPAISGLDGDTRQFSVGGDAMVLDAGTALGVSDLDNAALASATVQITGGYQSGEDVLAFANDGATMGNIAGAWDSGTGTLTLTSAGQTATPAQWAAALRAVTYQNTDAGTANTATRTVTFTVNDGTDPSAGAAVSVSLVRAPILDLNGATAGTGYAASFTEDAGPVAIVDATADLSDDNANLNQMVFTLTNPQAGDALTLAGRASGDVVNGITITYTSASVVTLSGSAAKADYVALLREARFNNTSHAPSTTQRSISITARDTDNNTSTAATATVAVTAADDQPVIGGAAAGQAVTDTATISPFSAVTVTEADGETVTVTISVDTAAIGSFTTLNGFTDAGGGTWTFTGTAAAAQTALQGMVYTPAQNRGVAGATETATFTIAVEDADGATDPVQNATTTVVVTSVNDAPTLGGLGGDSMTVVAGSGPQALTIAADAAVGDAESHVRGGTLTIHQTGGSAGGWALASGTSGADTAFA